MNDNPENSRQEAIREAQKQIIRNFFLALAALVVLLFACYAWFASNTTVSGTNMSVSLIGTRFELASVGGEGIFDNKLPIEENNVYGIDWEFENEGKITDSYTTVLWRVSESSNLGNYSNSDSGIEPGSSGILQFYVVPKDVSPLNLTISLEFIPLTLTDDGEEFTPIYDDVAKNFLKGHLLVHYRLPESEKSTLVDPESGSFPLTVEGAEPVRVRLEWNWPYLLENVLRIDGVQSILAASPKYFLYDGNSPVTEPFSIPQTHDSMFRKYSNFYNNADQYIGNSMKAVLLRLTAEEK